MSVEQIVTCDNCGREGAKPQVVFLAEHPKARTAGAWIDLCIGCLADVRALCGIR